MKVINNIIKVLSIVLFVGTIILYVVFQKTESKVLGKPFSVIISSFLIFLITYFPSFLKKRDILITKFFYSIILTATLLSLGLGFIFMFYAKLNHFDTAIHFMNGGIIVVVFFVILYHFTKEPEKYILPIIVISMLISLSLSSLWEIFEFTIDLIIPGSNMQRFQDIKTGIDFVGQEALYDTMIDLIVATIGTIIAGVFLYFDSLKNKKFINAIIFRKIEKETIEK